MKLCLCRIGFAAATALATISLSLAAGPAPRQPEARPPVWSSDVKEAFFDDARQQLDGARPDYTAKSAAPKAEASAATESTPAGFVWSKLITARTIESEVKRATQQLDKEVTTPTDFKGGGYKLARRDFSLLAALFAVVGQYDADVRWQDAAPGLRDAFARAGYNAKVGTDQTYNEAKQRKQDLADLIAGNRPKIAKAEAAVDDWSQVAARPPLMQRMNIAHQERITKWLGDEKTFHAKRDDIRHEAELVAMIADIIARSNYEFSDDDTYTGYARDLKAASSDLATAADKDNFTDARAAADRAGKACQSCHEGYRG